jgi:L-lysine 6-transaminase
MEKTKLMVEAEQVREVLSQCMLADGLDLVIDFDRSHGSRIYDAARGEFFVDFFGCFATIPLGYNHPRLRSPEAVGELGRAAVQKPSNSDLYSIEMARFVETFCRAAKPDYMKYLFFIEGGTLAVENALKVAFDWKVRKNFAAGLSEEKGFKVIHFQQAFHGRSGYTLSLTNTADPRKTQYFPKFEWPRVLNPKCRFPLQGTNLDRVREAEAESLRQIQTSLDENPGDIACILLEPIQGEGGDNHFRPEFHRELRKLCDEHEILLIYDEVQTGLGSTGKMWAAEHFVQPDIIAFGKKAQVCGVMVGERLDEVPDNVFHVSSRINSTWGGNLVDMVRCRLHLEVYEDELVVEYSAKLGEKLLNELRVLEDTFPALVSNSRGRGLFCALDLPDTETRDRLVKRLFENRLIMLGCGDRSIRFRPALNIPEEDLFRGLDIIRKVFAEES